jgi:hypothetical protein
MPAYHAAPLYDATTEKGTWKWKYDLASDNVKRLMMCMMDTSVFDPQLRATIRSDGSDPSIPKVPK